MKVHYLLIAALMAGCSSSQPPQPAGTGGQPAAVASISHPTTAAQPSNQATTVAGENSSANARSSASNKKASPEYVAAYKCAKEALASDYGPGPAAFCLGNSRDPSKLEEQAYADAERDSHNANHPGSPSTGKSSPEYVAAYKCAKEALASDYGPGPAAFCLGNSRDPSKLEEQAYADAERDYKAKGASASNQCPFAYAVWIADGSHADGFAEGPQKETKLKSLLTILPGRETSTQFFDKDGKQINPAVAGSWFTVTKGQYGGNEYHLSDLAKKSCTKQQLG